MLYFNPDFVKQNGPRCGRFISDFVAATKYYMSNTREAREAISQGQARGNGSGHLSADGRAQSKGRRSAVARVSRGACRKALLRAGYIDKTIDIGTIIDTSLFPER